MLFTHFSNFIELSSTSISFILPSLVRFLYSNAFHRSVYETASIALTSCFVCQIAGFRCSPQIALLREVAVSDVQKTLHSVPLWRVLIGQKITIAIVRCRAWFPHDALFSIMSPQSDNTFVTTYSFRGVAKIFLHM